MRARHLLLIAATLLSAAPAPKEEDIKKDKEMLKGAWRVTTLEMSGKDVPEEKIKRFEIVFGLESVTIKANTQERESSYTLDTSKKPKTIDLVFKDKTTVGIYQLEGDRLKLCLATEGAKKRPSDFVTKEGSDTTLFLLRRQK